MTAVAHQSQAGCQAQPRRRCWAMSHSGQSRRVCPIVYPRIASNRSRTALSRAAPPRAEATPVPLRDALLEFELPAVHRPRPLVVRKLLGELPTSCQSKSGSPALRQSRRPHTSSISGTNSASSSASVSLRFGIAPSLWFRADSVRSQPSNASVVPRPPIRRP